MSGEFVDTNVLVYAFDTSAGARHDTARQLVLRLDDDQNGLLSIQVLQELVVNLARKVRCPLKIETVIGIVEDLSNWPTFAPAAEDVIAAALLGSNARISFWDAMIVHAASQLGATILWTEDLNPGQTIAGVEIRSPFAPTRVSESAG